MMNPHFKNAVIAVTAEFAIACAMHCHAAVYEFANKAEDHNLPDPAPFGQSVMPGPSDEMYLSVLDAHKTLTLTNDWVSMISAV